MALITQREIVEAFERLGQLAEAQGEKISLVLAGGALMVLAYDARQSTRDVDLGPIIFLAPGIEVYSPTVGQLLAMKLSAWRDDVDVADARRLLQEFPPGSGREAVWKEVEPYLVPGSELKAQYAFWDLWETLHGGD